MIIVVKNCIYVKQKNKNKSKKTTVYTLKKYIDAKNTKNHKIYMFSHVKSKQKNYKILTKL